MSAPVSEVFIDREIAWQWNPRFMKLICDWGYFYFFWWYTTCDQSSISICRVEVSQPAPADTSKCLWLSCCGSWNCKYLRNKLQVTYFNISFLGSGFDVWAPGPGTTCFLVRSLCASAVAECNLCLLVYTNVKKVTPHIRQREWSHAAQSDL